MRNGIMGDVTRTADLARLQRRWPALAWLRRGAAG